MKSTLLGPLQAFRQTIKIVLDRLQLVFTKLIKLAERVAVLHKVVNGATQALTAAFAGT